MTAQVGTAEAPPVEAELATWRPAQVVAVDGWRVGLSGGFTRRANSAVARGEVEACVARLEEVEAVFAGAGQRPVVRVCPATGGATLDAALAARGYAVAARTLLMACPVPDGEDLDGPPTTSASTGRTTSSAAAPHVVTVADEPDEDWLGAWLAVKAGGAVGTTLPRAIVTGSPARYLTARSCAGEPLGVVRVAVAEGWAAVSCLMVAERARRQGVASLLTHAAVAEGRAAGAGSAFVQVEAANTTARALYDRLGFAVVQEYHYRER